MEANFNQNTINSRINKVIDQIKELVEVANKYTDYGMPDIRQNDKRPERYFDLMGYLDYLLEVRRKVHSDIESYIEELSRKQDDIDSKIANYSKPTVAPITAK